MATAYSALLGLALPVTGELSGTWGTTVNTAITQLIEDSVAGTTTLSSDADVTLTETDGASNQARAAVLLWTASGSVTRNITAPAQSKVYVVVNSTGGSQSIVLRGAGPTAGITVAAAEKCIAAWNGSDFVKVSSSVSSGTVAIANGGTGQTSATPAFDALAPTTTLGDVIYHNGTDNVRLAVGANNKVFTVVAGAPAWADAPGGSMVYPGAGIPVSTGSAWDTSLANPASAFVGTTDVQTLTNKTVSTGSTWNGNVIGVAYGGTGAATALLGFNALSPLTTQGDVLYHNGTNNVRLAKGTASQVLRMNSGATAPEWASGVTSPVAITDGGTGQITQTAAFDALAPTTTAGDTIYYNGTDNVRVPIGEANTLLASTGSAPSWTNSLQSILSIKGTHGQYFDLTYGTGTGACGILTIAGDTASSGNVVGGWVDVYGGAGIGTGAGGKVKLTGGPGGTSAASAAGHVELHGGAAGTGSSVAGSNVAIRGGAGDGSGAGGFVTLDGGVAGASGAGGSISITASNGNSAVGGDINLSVGTGSSNGFINFTNTAVVNGAVATALTSVGPTGAATTVQGWLRVKVDGVTRYIPFF